MIEIFFRIFFKIFFFFSFLIYVVFFVVLGYRFDLWDIKKEDSFLQIVGWDFNGFVNIENNKFNFTDNGEINLFYMRKGCYNINFNNMKKVVCLDSNQYVQYPLVKDVNLRQVEFIDNSIIDDVLLKVDYYNNCIYNKCFNDNILGIYKLKDYYIVNTYSDLYLCSYRFEYCKILFNNMNDKYVVAFSKKGIYLIDKKSNIYLLEIK